MKNFRSFALVTAMAAIVLFALTAQAQQSDNGSGAENTYGKTGDATTGGDNATGGTATYVTPATSGPVSGYANVAGAGVSYTHIAGIDTISTSKSSFSFDVSAVGPQSTITINSLAGQDDWATATSPASGNYADGGNGTKATLVGSSAGDGTQCDPLTGDGDATAKGKTVVSSTIAPNGLSATSTAKTIGSSDATGLLGGGTPQLSTGVAGAGGIEGGAYVAGANNSGASGSFAANAQYGATNASGSTAGILQANGATSTSVSPSGNAASASTTVSSQAQASQPQAR